MFVLPNKLIELNERLSRWVDTSTWFHKIDEQRQIERIFYRYHILMGVLIIAGSLYSLWFLWRLQGGALLVILPALQNRVLLEVLEATASGVLLIGNLIALIIGIVVLVRPSLLKALEIKANSWFETEQTFNKLNRRVDLADQFLPNHPRLYGLLIMIGSLYILSNTLISVFSG